MKKRAFILPVISIPILILLFSTSFSCSENKNPADDIVGAWKGKVEFKTGAFAEMKNWEFMWVFNNGGTMTESSNYDGVPPTPPAYGIWKKIGDRQYEARYEFFITQIPASFEDLTKAGGFPPAGYGVLLEKIILSADGQSYSSTIKLKLFDQTGKQTVFNDEATAEAKRMEFDSK
jgi:hypothetical protein